MEKKYKVTIGLEIHAELKTQTKMFCSSKNDTDETRPNVNVCPVCMGHPGTLPTINREAVKSVLKVGVALGSKLADFTEFDRKNYFYPDIPKGYQISQYAFPLVTGGILSGVSITRVHLEEDTASSSHDEGEYSLVNFNRAGVPLMELVTDPVIHSAEEAGNFARELQLLLRTLKISGANMEKGEMRVEANISVSDSDVFGTKVEVKNLNSFRAVEKAIAFEVERHISLIESGKKVTQETRGWDDSTQKTFSQRAKEDSHDYRYFPDPDLPKLKLSLIDDLSVEDIQKSLPELPWKKRERLKNTFGIKEQDINLYLKEESLLGFFESVVSILNNDLSKAQLTSNYIMSDLVSQLKLSEEQNFEKSGAIKLKLSPSDFAKLIDMISNKTLSSRGGKDILKYLMAGETNTAEIAKKYDLIQKSDEGSLITVVRDLIQKNPSTVAEYKSGKVAVLQYLVGLGMKATRGSGNPEVLKKIILDEITK